MMLGVEPRTSHMLGKLSTELHLQLLFRLINIAFFKFASEHK
jgi:hypothetical protein